MRKPLLTNKTLEYWIRGPPKNFFFYILGIFLVIQIFYYSIDAHNFSKYYELRGDFIGDDDFITFLYRPKPRAQTENVVVTIGGDLRYGTHVMRSIGSSNNITKPLAGLVPVFENSDINFLNLDGPITNSENARGCTRTEAELSRCCADHCFWKNDASILPALKEIGVNGIGVENDHIFDYGREGLEDTLYHLRKEVFPYSGLGYRILYRVKECNLMVLSYNWAYQGEGFYNRVKEMMKYDLTNLKADSFIVLMHGGNQNGGAKTEFQEDFAKVAIDNGAGIVIGTHSRARQESQTYKEKKIYYGIGSVLDENFMGKDHKDFSLLQFEVEKCRSIINVHEIKAKRDTDNMEVFLVK